MRGDCASLRFHQWRASGQPAAHLLILAANLPDLHVHSIEGHLRRILGPREEFAACFSSFRSPEGESDTALRILVFISFFNFVSYRPVPTRSSVPRATLKIVWVVEEIFGGVVCVSDFYQIEGLFPHIFNTLGLNRLQSQLLSKSAWSWKDPNRRRLHTRSRHWSSSLPYLTSHWFSLTAARHPLLITHVGLQIFCLFKLNFFNRQLFRAT